MWISPWLLIASLLFLVLVVGVIFRRQVVLAALIDEHLEEAGGAKGFQGKKVLEVIPEPPPAVVAPAIAEAKLDAPC